jgi:hypothetical protein
MYDELGSYDSYKDYFLKIDLPENLQLSLKKAHRIAFVVRGDASLVREALYNYNKSSMCRFLRYSVPKRDDLYFSFYGLHL